MRSVRALFLEVYAVRAAGISQGRSDKKGKKGTRPGKARAAKQECEAGGVMFVTGGGAGWVAGQGRPDLLFGSGHSAKRERGRGEPENLRT